MSFSGANPTVQTGADNSLSGWPAANSNVSPIGDADFRYYLLVNQNQAGLTIRGQLTIPRNEAIIHEANNGTVPTFLLDNGNFVCDGSTSSEARKLIIIRLDSLTFLGFDPSHGCQINRGTMTFGSQANPFTMIESSRAFGFDPQASNGGPSGTLDVTIHDLLLKNNSTSTARVNYPAFTYRNGGNNWASSNFDIRRIVLDGYNFLDVSGGSAVAAGAYPNELVLLNSVVVGDNGAGVRRDAITTFDFIDNSINAAPIDFGLNTAGADSESNITFIANSTRAPRIGTRQNNANAHGCFAADRIVVFSPSIEDQENDLWIPESRVRTSAVGSWSNTQIHNYIGWDGKRDYSTGATGVNFDGGVAGRQPGAYDYELTTNADAQISLRMSMGVISNSSNDGNNWQSLTNLPGISCTIHQRNSTIVYGRRGKVVGSLVVDLYPQNIANVPNIIIPSQNDDRTFPVSHLNTNGITVTLPPAGATSGTVDVAIDTNVFTREITLDHLIAAVDAQRIAQSRLYLNEDDPNIGSLSSNVQDYIFDYFAGTNANSGSLLANQYSWNLSSNNPTTIKVGEIYQTANNIVLGANVALDLSVPVPVRILVTNLRGEPIQGARVYIEAGEGGSAMAGEVIMNQITNSNGLAIGDFRYTIDQPIRNSKVRRSSSPPLYRQTDISGVITSAGLNITVLALTDE